MMMMMMVVMMMINVDGEYFVLCSDLVSIWKRKQRNLVVGYELLYYYACN